MTAYTNADGEHKGIAHGLDTILDATYTHTRTTGAKEAIEWAMTYTPDAPSDDADDVEDPSADVITCAFSGGVGGDFTMDMGDPDYASRYGQAFDEHIDANNVPIIQAAGNKLKSDKDEYTLGWGADSYNAIVVGASTASGDNKPRAENKVRLSSGRGPTPLKRKKPDVVAPGEGITTTSPNGGYGSISGTSAAVPHVAGAILLFADHGLSNPMMQKALLINSAEDRGSTGWDKDWGWGYIDLYTALEQIDYTLHDTIRGDEVKWYKGTMSGCQTATLVWHKRSGVPLSNLDMVLYGANGRDKLDFSNSSIDNVEQVKMPEGHDGTVYIKIHYNVRYGYPETFGLALPSEFRPIEVESMGPPSP